MILLIGLGPIGANVGLRLAELGHEVIGLDLDARRRSEWSTAAGGAPGWSRSEDVPWSEVSTIIVSVRLADQLRAVISDLRDHLETAHVTLVTLTTLTPSDARDIFADLPTAWRAYEAPLSGGPEGARDGSMTLFVAGPEASDAERDLFDHISGRRFHADAYGVPALLKLCNNTLGSYNALATAVMLELAADHGVDPALFLDVVKVSSGQSWMSDRFQVFHDDLLFKDAHLLQQDLGAAPSISLEQSQPELSDRIAQARSRFGTNNTEA